MLRIFHTSRYLMLMIQQYRQDLIRPSFYCYSEGISRRHKIWYIFKMIEGFKSSLLSWCTQNNGIETLIYLSILVNNFVSHRPKSRVKKSYHLFLILKIDADNLIQLYLICRFQYFYEFSIGLNLWSIC